ncbi:MAG: SH3 domain-containing protein [Leptospiraceae bacterium]|nr:SH3 domain-containing protein [Leptospiraceae bacterium]MCP5512963.1 SH3 domain-containing protein [Leptospiraceae bacterium]
MRYFIPILFLFFSLGILAGEKGRVNAKSGLIVREEPGTNGKRIGKIPFKKIVPVLNVKVAEMNEVWYQVKYRKIKGWVSGSYLDLVLPNDKEKTVVGRFTGVEQGDYFHLNLETDSGPTSFVFLRASDGIQFEEFESQPEKYKNKKISVKYKPIRLYIPEAGGYDTWDIVLDIQLQK